MVRTGWLDDHLLKRCSALHACSGSPLLERTLCPFLPLKQPRPVYQWPMRKLRA